MQTILPGRGDRGADAGVRRDLDGGGLAAGQFGAQAVDAPAGQELGREVVGQIRDVDGQSAPQQDVRPLVSRFTHANQFHAADSTGPVVIGPF